MVSIDNQLKTGQSWSPELEKIQLLVELFKAKVPVIDDQMGDTGKGGAEGDRVGGVEWCWVESKVRRWYRLLSYIFTDAQSESTSLTTGVRLQLVPFGADERGGSEEGVGGDLAEDGQL